MKRKLLERLEESITPTLPCCCGKGYVRKSFPNGWGIPTSALPWTPTATFSPVCSGKRQASWTPCCSVKGWRKGSARVEALPSSLAAYHRGVGEKPTPSLSVCLCAPAHFPALRHTSGTFLVYLGLLPNPETLVKPGGRGRSRTPDPLIKSQLLCQLSYTPTHTSNYGSGGWT